MAYGHFYMSLTEYQKFISQFLPEKHRKYAKYLTLFIFIIVSISAYKYDWLNKGFASISGPPETPITTPVVNVTPDPAVSEKSLSCAKSDFRDLKTRWNTISYEKMSDGYLCQNKDVTYFAPEIWLKEDFPLNFQNASLKAEIRPDTGQKTIPPGLVISLGKDPRLFSFLINDGGPQLVSFKKIVFTVSGSGFEPISQADTLDDPIQPDTQITVSVTAVSLGTSTVSFVFNVEYISAVTGDTENDQFSYEVELPYTNPLENGPYTRFGFSVFKGNCIRPVAFEACWQDN
jgi:hypothetical protein